MHLAKEHMRKIIYNTRCSQKLTPTLNMWRKYKHNPKKSVLASAQKWRLQSNVEMVPTLYKHEKYLLVRLSNYK